MAALGASTAFVISEGAGFTGSGIAMLTSFLASTSLIHPVSVS